MQFYANFAVPTKNGCLTKFRKATKIAKIVDFVVAFNPGQFIKW